MWCACGVRVCMVCVLAYFYACVVCVYACMCGVRVCVVCVCGVRVYVVCVCVWCACLHTFMHVWCACMYACVHVCVRVSVHVWCACMRACVVCVYACVCGVRACMRVWCVCMHACVVCVHVCVYVECASVMCCNVLLAVPYSCAQHMFICDVCTYVLLMQHSLMLDVTVANTEGGRER